MDKIHYYINKIKRIKIMDIFHVFLFVFAIIPAFVVRHKSKKIWLVCEESDTARCNGYCFYKYMREKHPQENVIYAIKDCYDFRKVRDIGKTVKYGSFLHWIYYLSARYNVSSQKGGKPNAAVCYFLEVILGITTNRIFLQHGVTINEGKWLYYNVSKFDLFICGVKPEYEFVKKRFGYRSEQVVYTGFARWDYLRNYKTKKKRIVVMPTWREWLTSKEKFLKSTYFKTWSEFLTSPCLHSMISKYNLEVIFYPHHEMQPYINIFKEIKTQCVIANMEDYDVQELLGTGELLITDYSSVFFDFLYLKKNVIFYQFDKGEYRKKQYRKGWFNYEKNGFTNYCESKEGVFEAIYKTFADNLSYIDDKFYDECFCLNDAQNCSRIYDEIVKRC